MGDYQNFKVNTDNILGYEHDAFKNKLMQLSLTNTASYFNLRNQIYANIKTGMIKKMYITFYNLMTIGALTTNAGLADAPGSAANGVNIPGFEFTPNFPEDKVSEFALDAARTLEKLLAHCLDLIMPPQYYEQAQQRAAKKSDLQIL